MKILFAGVSVFVLFLYLMPSMTKAGVDDRQTPVVVELFTSQSCSSCPPADKVLEDISRNPNVIALGCHVTYWDHLSWKDTLSLPSCTELQRGFNAGIGSRRVYTPQMVVNGRVEFVGSQKRSAINAVQAADNIVPLSVAYQDNHLSVHIPELNGKGNQAVLMVVGFDKAFTQSIPSGENSGETISYTNPVRFIDYPDLWDGQAQKLNIPVPVKTSGGYAVIIREGQAGRVIAAGQFKK